MALSAIMVPEMPGFALVWRDDFDGPAGAGADPNTWNIKVGSGPNHELQRYTNSAANSQMSGDGQLYIIPRKDGSTGNWTSARLEGWNSFSCDPGHLMVFQAEIRLGRNPGWQQQGIWPAYWTLGLNVRQGAGWPKCGEWDILELINGSAANMATLHFLNPAFNGHEQRSSGQVNFDRTDFHTWALKVDRTPANIREEKLTWYLDGNPFFEVSPGALGNPDGSVQWEDVAHREFFPILNVAVGGDFPGMPNGQTADGLESGMAVRYVAVYKSNTQ